MELNLLIVDDDGDFSTTFSDYASQTIGFARPTAAATPSEALRFLRRRQFNIVLVDLLLGRSSGSDLIGAIKAAHKNTVVIVLSAHSDDHLISEAFGQGADGYLLKTQSLSEIMAALLQIYSGGMAVDPNIIRKIIIQLRAERSFEGILGELTARENSLLKLLSQGLTYKQIAQMLDLSTQTVYSHAKRMFRKLKVRSKTEAVARYLRSTTSSSAT